jgi:hypothetical protein
LEGGIMVTEEHPGGIPHRILRESEWYWLGRSGRSALFTSQYHSDSDRKLHRLDNFESHGLEIMSEMTAKPMWKWNLESFAQETSC